MAMRMLNSDDLIGSELFYLATGHQLPLVSKADAASLAFYMQVVYRNTLQDWEINLIPNP